MDKFEKHIRDHKDQFDEHKADKANIWKAIESKLDGKLKLKSQIQTQESSSSSKDGEVSFRITGERGLSKDQTQESNSSTNSNSNSEVRIASSGVGEQRGKTLRPWYLRRSIQVAASMALITGLGIGLMINNQHTTEIAEPTELLEIDFYYEKLIAQQVKMIEDSPQLSEMEKEEFLGFFEEMDQEYLVLKSELQEGIDFENVLEAIILHYQKRLDITESMLTRINSSKNGKEQKSISL